MISKLKCWWSGHRRGKRVGKNIEDGGIEMRTHNVRFYCPRCGAQWSRKAKA